MRASTASSSSPPRTLPRLLSETVAEDPRATLGELVELIYAHFGERLIGLYLFGSLATGDFFPARSDLDLFAVLASAVADEGDDLYALRQLHEQFESERPDWRDRIEVAYVSSDVLATFASVPTGTIARVSPGEPLHLRELDGNLMWLLDWNGAINGETLLGPRPLAIGPAVDADAFRAAVLAQLHELGRTVRASSVAYVPAQQGYIVATVCRALYSLATDEQTSKEHAVTWFAEQRPELADFVRSAYNAYRADIREPHERLIKFVEQAAAEAS